MSVKRYFVDYDEGYGCNLIEAPDGDLVLHTDYAALEARCAGLEAALRQISILVDWDTYISKDIARSALADTTTGGVQP